MYDVTSSIEHDVSVVTIFDLQKVADDAVGSHGNDKVAPGTLEFFGRLVAVRLAEVVEHTDIRLSSELIARLRIRNALDNSTLKINRIK